jgi:hypothetical protein
MSIEKKETVSHWSSGKYKTRIQRRQGWAGPHYYQCRVKQKRLSGLFSTTIIKETFSREFYDQCPLIFIHRTDTIFVDICNKKTFKR